MAQSCGRCYRFVTKKPLVKLSDPRPDSRMLKAFTFNFRIFEKRNPINSLYKKLPHQQEATHKTPLPPEISQCNSPKLTQDGVNVPGKTAYLKILMLRQQSPLMQTIIIACTRLNPKPNTIRRRHITLVIQLQNLCIGRPAIHPARMPFSAKSVQVVMQAL